MCIQPKLWGPALILFDYFLHLTFGNPFVCLRSANCSCHGDVRLFQISQLSPHKMRDNEHWDKLEAADILIGHSNETTSQKNSLMLGFGLG